MIKQRTTGTTRSVILGILVAIVSFSYALATSGDHSSRVLYAGSRAVFGSDLTFSNPFVAGPGSDRDLGDAVIGSGLTRLIRAQGGVAPYSFTSSSSAQLSAAAFRLASNGIFTTIGTAVGNVASPFRFEVTVRDSLGTNPNVHTEYFRLNILAHTEFRFAQDGSLGETTLYRDFNAKIDTINGNGAKTYAVTNVRLNGAPRGSLEEAGFSLSNSGWFFGKAREAGTLTFHVEVTDAAGNRALSRNGSSVGEDFSLTIIDNKATTGNIVTTAVSIKLDGSNSNEGLSYSGIVNLNGSSVASLSGQTIQVRIGRYTAPVVSLDAKGKAGSAKGQKTDVVKATLSTTGALKFAVSKTGISSILGPISGSTVTFAVEVIIGDVIVGSEVLRFDIKGTAPKQTLTYKIIHGSALAGTFFITSVKASDSGAGDKWTVAFIALPAEDDSFAGATTAEIGIGVNSVNSIPVVEKGGKLSGGKTAAIKSFKADGNSGKGSVTTNELPSADTGILPGASANTSLRHKFAMRLAVTAGSNQRYVGEGSAPIFPSSKGYSSVTK